MSRYLCCGDLHIGAGRALYPERLAEQQQVWQEIIDLAAERECDAILFAGDAFHRNHPDDDERQAFTVPLLSSSVPVFAINGNSHDWRGHGKRMAVETAALGARLLTVSTVPETIMLPGGVSLCTLPWTPVARLVAEAGGGDRDDINMVAAGLLVEAARGLRGQVEGPAILMGHWSVSDSITPTGLDVQPHIFREPVLPVGDLGHLGFDAVALGHIHRPQAFGGYDTACPIFYVGSPLPLDFGEANCEHGVWLLDTESWAPEFVPVESRPFLTLIYPDLKHEQEPPDVTGAVVRLKATLEAGEDTGGFAVTWKDRLLDAGAHWVRVDVEVERAERPQRGVTVDTDMSAVEQLDVWLREAAGVNGDEGARLVERGRTYLEGVA